MRQLRLAKMMLFVTDLDEAERFYSGVLGFPVRARSDGRLSLGHDGCELVAYACAKNASPEDYAEVARSVFVFGVTSIDSVFAELKAKGVRFLHEQPAKNAWCRYAAFVDPFGNVHEISEPRSAPPP
jgi:catechol 2,3-dioxygenase-like lactoylglutathione lyase family enzyme